MHQKPVILLVQTVQTLGNGTKRYLENTGYEVVWAGSGMTALSIARRRQIDIILLDVALADMEGGDLCRRFRLRDDTASIPILMLTTRDYRPESFQGSADGPDDYLAKPYSENELSMRITSALRARKLKTELEEKNRLLTEKLTHELEEKNRLLAEQLARPDTSALVDPATGLFGRKQFEAMFSKEFKRAMRFKQQMSCMLIDLDGQKIGRKTDPSLVRAIIGLVQGTIREVDTAAWWTGEAFIVLLPNTIRHDALQAAGRILEAVAQHPFTWPDATRVALNIGVAGLPDPEITSEQMLIESAASALRRARECMAPFQRHAAVPH